MDSIICADGRRGLGKSTLLYWLAKEMSPKTFSLERNFVFRRGNEEMITKAKALSKYETIVSDEGQRQFYNMDFASKAQNDLYKFLTENRKANLNTAFACPKFKKLGTSLMDIVDFRIHVITRGVGVVFQSVDNAVDDDPWMNEECIKIWKRRTRQFASAVDIDTDTKLDIYIDFPTYTGIVTWPKMPEDEEAKYLALDAEAKRLDSLASTVVKRPEEFEYFGRLAYFCNSNYPQVFTQQTLRAISSSKMTTLQDAIHWAAKEKEEKEKKKLLEEQLRNAQHAEVTT